MRSKGKGIVGLLLVILLAMTLFAGCGETATVEDTQEDTQKADTSETAEAGDSSNAEVESGEGKTIGFSIAMLAGSPFWQIIVDEMDRGFTELGYKFVVLDGQGDVGKQTSDCEDLIAQQVDLLLINPYDSKAIVNVTLKAKEAGIPVFATDIPIGEGGYWETITICDNLEIGYNLGWYCGELFDTPDVRIILISGYPGGIDSYQRRMGFLEGINAYQLEKFNRTGVEIVYHGWGDYAFEPANKTMEDAIVRVGNEFDVLYCENDSMAIGAMKAMQEAGLVDDKVIIGVDGLREMFELIMDGSVTATGLNSPVELAEVTVQTAHDFLNGKEVPLEINTTPDVVDKDNVEKYYDPESKF